MNRSLIGSFVIELAHQEQVFLKTLAENAPSLNLTGAPLFCRAVAAKSHTVFDVVVDDEIGLLRREAAATCEHSIDFVDDRLGLGGVELVVFNPVALPGQQFTCCGWVWNFNRGTGARGLAFCERCRCRQRHRERN